MAQPWRGNWFLLILSLIFYSMFLVGLFGCLEDLPTLLIGWFCPCYLFGQNAEQIDGSNKITMCIGYACLSGCYLCCLLHKPKRQQLRAVYGLVEEPSDLISTCCLSACANCQEAREMQMRGLSL
jgi:Cys-rich protein (TIGR01571 family)